MTSSVVDLDHDPPQDGLDPGANRPLNGRLALVFFASVVVLYLITRVVGLVDYPIYFFCDEAIQTTIAADFLRDDCRSPEGELFPTYFKNYTTYNLSASVYAQVLPAKFFPRSVFLTRLTAMVFTLLAVIWVALILKDCFRVEHWWMGSLLLSVAPAWFLHSRTAFETSMMVSFYAGFVYEYMRYRSGDTWRLLLALFWGSLAFYSYSPGRMVVVVTGVLLLATDLKYHWRHRRVALAGAGLLVITALPIFRFLKSHPSAGTDQLRGLASYWLRPISLGEKIELFATEYFQGLSPHYWFFSNDVDIARHLMGPHPHIFTWLLPLFAIGVVLAVISVKNPPHRVLLLALLSAPTGAAMVELGITRALVYLVPALLLTALGLDLVMRRIGAWPGCRPAIAATVLFVLLGAVNIGLLNTALSRGPTWCDDYTMSGMQWGARQLFPAIDDFMREHPDVKLRVTPDWANGTDTLARFFFPDGIPFEIASSRDVEYRPFADLESWVFVVTPHELQSLEASGKLSEIDILQTIPYPNGESGFFFLRLTYRDDFLEILETEREERRRPTEATIRAWDTDLTVRFPRLDMGDIDKVFDGDDTSLARSQEANPFVLEIQFAHVMRASGAWFVTGSSPMEIAVTLFAPDSEAPVTVNARGQGKLEDPRIFVDFGETQVFDRAKFVLNDRSQQEPGNVHLWELSFVD